MDLQTVALILTLIGTLAYWLYTIFIAPIKLKMDIIMDTVSDVKEGLRDMRGKFSSYQDTSLADRRALSERVSALEQADKNTNKRLDRVENALNLHLERCREER